MLEVTAVSASYGVRNVLDAVSIDVPKGGAVAVLGPNGAGKSTLLRVISGIVRPVAGTVRIDGVDLAGASIRDRVRRGIVHVPEGRQLFPGLTVHENLAMGALLLRRSELAAGLEMVEAYFPQLAQRRNQKAGTMSGGEQALVAIARGLMARPSLLLLDEPSLGLAPSAVLEIGRILREITSRERISLLIVEQNLQLAWSVADYAYLMNAGAVQLQGPARELREHDVLSQRST